MIFNSDGVRVFCNVGSVSAETGDAAPFKRLFIFLIFFFTLILGGSDRFFCEVIGIKVEVKHGVPRKLRVPQAVC